MLAADCYYHHNNNYCCTTLKEVYVKGSKKGLPLLLKVGLN